MTKIRVFIIVILLVSFAGCKIQNTDNFENDSVIIQEQILSEDKKYSETYQDAIVLSVDVESYKEYMVDKINLLVNRRIDDSDDIFISIESIELFSNNGIQIHEENLEIENSLTTNVSASDSALFFTVGLKKYVLDYDKDESLYSINFDR